MESSGGLCKISGVKIFKRLLVPVFIPFQPNFMESMVIRGEYRLAVILFGRSANKKKKYGHLQFLLTRSGTGNFKMLLLLQFSSNLTETLPGHWLQWWNTM